MRSASISLRRAELPNWLQQITGVKNIRVRTSGGDRNRMHRETAHRRFWSVYPPPCTRKYRKKTRGKLLHIRQAVNADDVTVDEALETLRSFPGGRDTSTYQWLMNKKQQATA